jgi:[ribosomal protein S5]-alanine N-acetyltransferase
MLKLYGKNIHLIEFDISMLDSSSYLSWVRDLNNISTIGRKEYLLSINKKKIFEYVNRMMDSESDSFFGIYDSIKEECFGTVKIGHIDWRTGVGDVGIMIGDKKYRGKGLSKDIIHTIAKYGFETLSLRKLTAGCFDTNIPMKKCFESLGFTIEGVLKNQLLYNGNFIDHVLYACFKENLNTTK